MRLTALLVLFTAGNAMAQLPAVDPPDQFRLIGTPERSDSRCIGRPETPLCAVETLLACFARRDDALCWRVWHPPQSGIRLFPGETRPGYWWSYRVAGVERLGDDEAVIAIAGRNCGLQIAAPECRLTPAPPTSYRVKRQNGSWEVVDWSSPPGLPAGITR